MKRQPQIRAAALNLDHTDADAPRSAQDRMRQEIRSALTDLISGATPVRKDGSAVVGIVTKDGFISSSNHKRGLSIIKKGVDPKFTTLSGNQPEEGRFVSPKAIQEGSDSVVGGPVSGSIMPPWALDLLQTLYVANEMHGACIDVKATDVVFSGWEIEPVSEIQNGTFKVDEATLATAKNEVKQFLERCAVHSQMPLRLPFTSLLREAYADYQRVGMLEFEVLRNRKGFIGALSSIPAHTVNVLTNKETDRRNGCRYIQSRYGGRRYFLPFMDSVEFVNTKEGFDPLTSPIEEFPPYKEREKYMRLREWLPDAESAQEVTDEFEEMTSELFVLPRMPFTLSTVYGTPAGVAAFEAILGCSFIDDYNRNFFTSKGIPQYAVVIEGLSAPAVSVNPDNAAEDIEDPTADLENTIREFFQQNMRKVDRNVLVMSTFGETKVRFEKLSAEEVEGSFGDLEVRYNERIRLAHRVPPAALGVSEITRSGSGKTNSGNGRELSQMMRYRDHIVNPEQAIMSAVINAVIRGGLLIPFFNVTFNAMSIDEEVMQREFLLNELKEGGITTNEYRAESQRFSRTARPAIGKEDDDLNPANGVILRTAQVTVFGKQGITTTAPGDSASRNSKTDTPPKDPPKSRQNTP